MTFVDLYGTELDRELGTTDRTQRFTTVRRKAAINAAQLEFVKRTSCLTKQTTIAMVDATQEYDIEATITDFGGITAQGVSIKIVDSGGNIRYIEGNDLIETTVERLNVEQPGWRADSPSTPLYVYHRRDGGTVNLGFHPAPDITAGDTWTILLPYWMIPADMTADIDEPFTVSSNAIKSMRPYHRGLVHYAAYDLEKLRKDEQRAALQLQLFEQSVAEFLAEMTPKHGTRVRLDRNYRAQSGRRGGGSRGGGSSWIDSGWLQ